MHWMFEYVGPKKLIEHIDSEFKRDDTTLFERSSLSYNERLKFINTFFDEFELAINNVSTEIEKLLFENRPLDDAIQKCIGNMYLKKTSNFAGDIQRRSEGALEGAKIIQNPIEEIEMSNHIGNQQIYMKNLFLCYALSSSYFYAIENLAKLWLSINNAILAKKIAEKEFYLEHKEIRKELQKESDSTSKYILTLYKSMLNFRILTDYDHRFVSENCELLVPKLKNIAVKINTLSKNICSLWIEKIKNVK